MSNKLIVVTGATGTQGGSVITALLKQGGYAVRGVSRNADAPSAQAIQAKGVEMVSADLGDKDSLITAFKGAYAVFGNTVNNGVNVSEQAQGRNMVDACRANAVALFLWSSVPSALEASHGKYPNLSHFEDKQVVEKYIASVGQPAVSLHMGGFTDNLVNFHRFVQDANDPAKWKIVYPIVRADVQISTIWIEGDFGNIVSAVINKWEDKAWKGRLAEQPIPVAGYRISGQEMVESIKRVTGKDVEYVTIPAPPGMPPTFASMFHYFDDGFYNFGGSNPPELLLELGVKFSTFDDYVREKLAPIMQQAK